jgi:CelD/BcsL family acetyltransferase involved in cellulose biosynthesis
MSIASLSTAGTLEEPAVKPRRRWWRGPRFVVEVFNGADEALAALEAVQGELNSPSALTSTAFQTLNWLTVFYEELAPLHRAKPRLVVVTERNSGEVALILPLLIKRKRTLRVARFADLGVSDYGAPILGPALLKKRRSIRRAWRAVRHALRDVDLIRLENMPAAIGGIANPLITRSGLAPSRRPGSVIYVPGTIDDYLAGRGNKYRDEIERSTRLLEKEDAPRFARATDPEEIARVYSVLEEQQAARHATLGTKNILKQDSYRQFYERLVMDGSEVDLGHLFHLDAGVKPSLRFSGFCMTAPSRYCAFRMPENRGDTCRRAG